MVEADDPSYNPQRRAVLAGATGMFVLASGGAFSAVKKPSLILDDFSAPHPQALIGTSWRFAADTVMGGVSSGTIDRIEVSGTQALQLRGQVSLENNGGFIQAALPLAEPGQTLDASWSAGLELTVRGNGQAYSVHLRTDALDRPWQSYRSAFTAQTHWHTLRLPFAEFTPYRTDLQLDLRKLVRLGLVAIGRAFQAELAVSKVALYT